MANLLAPQKIGEFFYPNDENVAHNAVKDHRHIQPAHEWIVKPVIRIVQVKGEIEAKQYKSCHGCAHETEAAETS